MADAGDVRRALADAAAAVDAALDRAVTDEAEAIAQDQRDTVAVDQGTVRDAIEAVKVGPGEARVEITDPDAYHAVFLEFGRSRQTAQPFALPAAETSRAGRFVGRAIDEVRSTVDAQQ